MCVWNTVDDRSKATRNGLMTLELGGGASELVGGASGPVGGATVSTLTVGRSLELSRTSVVLRNHSSAGDISTLPTTVNRHEAHLTTVERCPATN